MTVLTKPPQVAALPDLEALQLVGIFQSVLTAVVWTPTPAAAATDSTRSCRFPLRADGDGGAEAGRAAWFPQDAYAVDVVGCRVCVTVARSAESARAVLEAARNAAPFIPRDLRLAFSLLGWRPQQPRCPADLLSPYAAIKLQELHVISVFGARAMAPLKGICVVSPLIPAEMSVLDEAIHDVCGSLFGWEPDVSLGGVGSLTWQLIMRFVAAARTQRLSHVDAAAVMQLSAAAHSLLVRGRTGVERQLPCMDLVSRPLRQTRDVVTHLGLGCGPGSDAAVEHTQRMLTVEGLAMVQDSFTMDAVVDLHVAVFSDLQARQMEVLSALPGGPARPPVARSRYRGPLLKMLVEHTGMVAESRAADKWFLLAAKVPTMLENRPHLVFGSRVHITYKVRRPPQLSPTATLPLSGAGVLLAARSAGAYEPLWNIRNRCGVRAVTGLRVCRTARRRTCASCWTSFSRGVSCRRLPGCASPRKPASRRAASPTTSARRPGCSRPCSGAVTAAPRRSDECFHPTGALRPLCLAPDRLCGMPRRPS